MINRLLSVQNHPKDPAIKIKSAPQGLYNKDTLLKLQSVAGGIDAMLAWTSKAKIQKQTMID